jgi:hypothetical protein
VILNASLSLSALTTECYFFKLLSPDKVKMDLLGLTEPVLPSGLAITLFLIILDNFPKII